MWNGCARWHRSAGPGFYRWLRRKQPGVEETAVRAAIQEIAVEHHRHYGYRRITAELRHRGMVVNRKRVLRMMQEDNLLAIRTRKFVRPRIRSTRLRYYLNLAKRMELTGIKPALGGRSHLYPSTAGVRLSGGGAGCIFTACGRVGIESQPAQYSCRGCAPARNRRTKAAARSGPSF